MRRADEGRRGLPFEVVALGLLFAGVCVAVAVTYALLDPHDLYNVSRTGLAGGLSRVLVLLNFPVALVAIAVLAFVADRLDDTRLRLVALVGIVLSAVVAWPGVVDAGDLDARPVNGIAAVGVAIPVALSVTLWKSRGVEPLERGNARLRLAIAGVVFLLGVPWILADVGVSLDGVPVLGTIYQTGELRVQPGDPVPHPAVHLGHHHGTDGVLFIWSALLLAPLLLRMRSARLQLITAAYVALMFCYGVGNLANDFWLEQIVKRGWTDWSIPNVTEPHLSIAWLTIVIGSVVLFVVFVVRTRRAPPDT